MKILPDSFENKWLPGGEWYDFTNSAQWKSQWRFWVLAEKDITSGFGRSSFSGVYTFSIVIISIKKESSYFAIPWKLKDPKALTSGYWGERVELYSSVLEEAIAKALLLIECP